jgi:ribosome biogenesis protein MAK21
MLPGRITSTHLIHWAYEDWLKDAYFRLIQQLEILANDEIEYSRIRSLDLVFGLLREKPEQEANLLKLLVNKLGDKDRKLASRSSHLLLQMQTIHPGMKAIIVRTIEQEVLLRPGTDYRTRCYAVNTLNQTILSSKEPAVAEMLLKIYFEMFGVFLKTHDPESSHLVEHESLTTQKVDKDKSTKKNVGGNVPDQESKEKLVAAILTGINRAVPFAVADGTLSVSKALGKLSVN